MTWIPSIGGATCHANQQSNGSGPFIARFEFDDWAISARVRGPDIVAMRVTRGILTASQRHVSARMQFDDRWVPGSVLMRLELEAQATQEAARSGLFEDSTAIKVEVTITTSGMVPTWKLGSHLLKVSPSDADGRLTLDHQFEMLTSDVRHLYSERILAVEIAVVC